MEAPDDLKYSKEHEWVRVDGDIGVIGISDYAQGELGDVVPRSSTLSYPRSARSLRAETHSERSKPSKLFPNCFVLYPAK